MIYSGQNVFRLTKAELKALCAFACRDKQRPALQNVHFSAPKGAVAATDGHALACVHAEQVDCTAVPFNVPAKTLAEHARRLKHGQLLVIQGATSSDSQAVRLWVTSEHDYDARESETTLTTHSDSTDFPPYEQVIPELDGTAPATGGITLCATYLARLELLQLAADANGVDVYSPGDMLSPVKVRVKGRVSEWTAVIAPVRGYLPDSVFQPNKDPLWQRYRRLDDRARRALEIRLVA